MSDIEQRTYFRGWMLYHFGSCWNSLYKLLFLCLMLSFNIRLQHLAVGQPDGQLENWMSMIARTKWNLQEWKETQIGTYEDRLKLMSVSYHMQPQCHGYAGEAGIFSTQFYMHLCMSQIAWCPAPTFRVASFPSSKSHAKYFRWAM